MYVINDIVIVCIIIGVIFLNIFVFPELYLPKLVLPFLSIFTLICWFAGSVFLTIICLIILLLTSFIFLIKSIAFPKIKINIQALKLKLKLFGVYAGVILIVVLLIFRVIVLSLNFDSDYRHNLLFTIFNTAIFGVYFSVLGMFNKGIRSKGLKVIVLLVLLIVFLVGFGFIDFQIELNIFIFNSEYNTYSTASDISAYFMLYNLVLFTGIIVISFFIASKRKGAD